MRRVVSCLALLAGLAPGAVLAQTSDAGTSTVTDGGPPDAGGCGSITFEGECQGNVVVYCDVEFDEIVTIDCEVDYAPTAICQTITPEYGVWCALAAGEQCIFEDGGEFFTDFCQGSGAGCVETLETLEEGTCQANLGACTADDVRSCRGQSLVYECNETQPWLVDCETFQGTCDDDHCVVPAGIICDDVILVCEPGLTCGVLGACEGMTMNQPDAGMADTGGSGLDAGTNGEEEDEGCGCATTHRKRSSPYLLLLVAAWFIVRRRER